MQNVVAELSLFVNYQADESFKLVDKMITKLHTDENSITEPQETID